MIAPSRRVGSAPVVRSFPPVPLVEVAEAADAEVLGDGSTLVKEAALDSREVVPGALFFCVAGQRTDGHRYAEEAAEAGAAALVVERRLDLAVPQIRVRSVREAMGPMASVVFGRPADSLTTVGITGTNGKTTTTYLLEGVFAAARLPPGLIGTTGARIRGASVPLARTTPEAPDLHRLLATMRHEGVRAVAMEVSSHALAYHRVDGLVLDAAMFTNLSQDHLDLHASMEAYFAAKARLFTSDLARAAVIGVDDEWGRRLAEIASVPVTTFGVDADADLRATEVRADAHGIAFRVEGAEVRSPLRGRFNVANCLGVLAVARAIGVELPVAVRGIADVSGVPGRMEPVEGGQGFLVMVDYAHTPDSILGVLRASRPLATGRLIVVFGCGGDRDRAKRPVMGSVATANADLTVVTTDNPRSEDPLAIIGAIEPGARAGGGAFLVEPDRRAAIRRALGEARAGDVVVIAGKGHETVQEFADREVPFDDRSVVREELIGLGVGA
jgi:UDP-N-acetylmuramoyl-L-alanyl-D-glutamate--2,6-diaminopimelate ligase